MNNALELQKETEKIKIGQDTVSRFIALKADLLRCRLKSLLDTQVYAAMMHDLNRYEDLVRHLVIKSEKEYEKRGGRFEVSPNDPKFFDKRL